MFFHESSRVFTQSLDEADEQEILVGLSRLSAAAYLCRYAAARGLTGSITIKSMTEPAKETPEPVWCIVANIVYERPYGPSGEETRSGTKHFAPGAKVYIVDFFWGMGGQDVTVVGRHRKSHRYITIVIRSQWLVNWRAELIYSPHVIREVITPEAYKPYPTWVERTEVGQLWTALRTKDENEWASSERAKERLESIIEYMKYWYESPRTKQPPVTRSPQPKSD